MDNEKRIRPSRQRETNSTINDLEPLTPKDEQEKRVLESLSISVPPAKVPRPNPALTVYRNQRVRLQLRDGVVISGTLIGTQWDFLRLEDIEEIGKDYKLKADWCTVKADSIVRVYPSDLKKEEISNR